MKAIKPIEQQFKLFESVIKNHHTPNHGEHKMREDIYKDIRFFIRFGKYILLIPLQGTFSNSVVDLTFNKWSPQYCLSFIAQIYMGFAATISILGGLRSKQSNPVQIAQSSAQAVYYLHACFLYTYFLKNTPTFLKTMKRWGTWKIYFCRKDVKLFRDAHLVFLIIMSSAILENIVNHLNHFHIIQTFMENCKLTNFFNLATSQEPGVGSYQIYYEETHKSWSLIIPYNAVLATMALVADKLSLYSWNFTDILILICSRAIYFKFKTIHMMAAERSTSLVKVVYNEEFWEQVCKDHLAVCKILKDFENFLSPLIFSVSSVNIYFICLQLFAGLTPSPNDTIVSTIYSAWSFIHLSGRMFIVAMFASRINDFSNQIGHLISTYCPTEYYTAEVKRADLRINSGPAIGLSGLGCFVLSKPYILSLMSCVFTIEIVFLQSYSMDFSN